MLWRNSLITPERLHDRDDVLAIFSEHARPEWLKGLASPYPSPEEEPEIPAMSERIVLLGDAHRRRFYFSIAALAIGYELCRCGHTWGTNDNHSEARNVYPQMLFAGARHVNLPVARLFADAGPGQIVKLEGRPHDFASENLALLPGPRAKHKARTVALEQAERLARDRPNRLPGGVSIPTYLANLHRLFAYHDALFGVPTMPSGEGE